jgi:response regulator RpfG family c-di-GMP phosphodiesterase
MPLDDGKADGSGLQDIHLLVVDDEKSILGIVGQFLKMKGYSVTCLSSGEEAVDFIKQNAVDLVLTDIKMPGMSGVELLKWVREYNRTLPVVITTGFPTLDTAIEALKLGAFDYLTKPFHLEEIAEKVKRALVSKQLEEENLLFSKLVSLHEVTKILASTRQLPELHRKVLDFSVKIAKADGASLMFFDDSTRPSLAEYTTHHPREFWMGDVFGAVSAWVARNEEPLVMETGETGMFREFPPLPDTIRSYIAFPLKTSQRTIGILNLVRLRDKHPFSNVDLEIVNVLASQASISVENVRLYQNIHDNYLKTVRAFALAVEAKDRYTHGHSENVMKYTVVIGKRLGLSDAELENVKYAGLLHDIGKIGTSELILNKPGRLTPAEFDEIKKHPTLGSNIIADVPFLRPLVPMVLHHHEFYDGSGYPSGISGEEIPFGARILSVADAYEAMTSDRPYRRSLSSQAALDILISGRGRQFDPKIVDVFREILRVRSA